MTGVEGIGLLIGGRAEDRSASPDVRNPLLKLPSACSFRSLPDDDRRALRELLDELRRDARSVADDLYARRKKRVASYWRACSVYAGHFARLVSDRAAARAFGFRPPSPIGSTGANPLLARPAARSIRALGPAARAAVRQLLIELRADAIETSHKSWEKSKSPMCAYWADVATFAGSAARFLRDPAAPLCCDTVTRVVPASASPRVDRELVDALA